MKLKEINNSSKKTKELIKQEFALLIAEKKEIKNITVTELVKRANLTRGTFYAHYDNIYDVASEIQSELLTKIFTYNTNLQTKNDLFNYIDSIFAYLKENEKMFKQLLTSDDCMLFLNRLNKKISTSLASTIGHNTGHLSILFFTNGVLNILIQYFRGEISENLNDICDYIKDVSQHLFFNNN